MAPSKASSAAAPFSKDERVLCFHLDMLYEAKVLDTRPSEDADSPGSFEYKIHYKGWKKSWDDWVPQDRVRKFTPQNQELAQGLHNQMKALLKLPKAGKRAAAAASRANGSDFSSARGSEERNASVAAQSGRGGQRRARDYEVENEDSFIARPSVKINIPDQIKAILVDDWENVTKSSLLVPIPAEHSVKSILKDYIESEKEKRPPGSAQADVLEEVIGGLNLYFDKCVGRILLYRFERVQYLEMREAIEDVSSDLSGKTIGDVYGAEHLCRLMVSLPELIAQTNMNGQSVDRIRDEILNIGNFLVRHATKYFAREYETPSPGYAERARA